MKYVLVAITLILSQIIQAENVAVITSGGVSKGAYQAGFLHYLDSFQKQNAEQIKPSTVFTGTSAGGINSLISLLSSCRTENLDTQKTTGYLFWKQGGLESIYDKEKVTSTHIFSLPKNSESMIAIRNLWFQGIKKDCSAYLGITLTHLNTKEYKLSDELTTPHMKEFIVLKITGNGPNMAPKIEPINIDQHHNFRIDFNGTDEEKYQTLEKILYATSAFPVAFEPVYLKYCYLKSNQNDCSKFSSDYFIDGGLFNNTPLSLAYKIEKKIKSKSKKTTFVIVDSDQHIYKNLLNDNKEKNQIKLTDITTNLFFNFMNTSQKSDLTEFARTSADDKNQVLSAPTFLPTASEPLFHFWGLFDEGFRTFDFYLGMNDARIFTETKLKNKYKLDIAFDPDTKAKMNCLKKFSDCHQVKDQNFLILLQTSIYKLYDMCLNIDDENVQLFSSLCSDVKKTKTPPKILATPVENPNIGLEESEIEFTIRLLHSLHYTFSYLKDTDTFEDTLGSVRSELREMLSMLASKQTEDMAALQAVRKNLFDYILFYEPMNNYWFVNVGKLIEIGYRANPTNQKILSKRFTLSLSSIIQSTHVKFNNQSQESSLSFLGGLYYQIPFFENRVHQLHAYTKYGYQLSTNSFDKSRACQPDDNIIACSTSIFQLGAGITFYDHFGLTYLSSYYKNPNNDKYVLDPTMLINLNFKFD